MRRAVADLRSTALGMSDQVAYGLSTFVVTATISRNSDSATLARFLILWSLGWGLAAALGEMIGTPLRLALPTQRVTEQDAQAVDRLVLISATCIAFVATGAALCGVGWLAAGSGIGALAAAGSAVSIRRARLYSAGHVATSVRNSVVNLLGTVACLFGVHVSDSEVGGWAMPIAAGTAIAPLWIAQRGRGFDAQRALRAARKLAVEGYAFAISVAIRILAYSVGMLTMVAGTRGLREAGLMGEVLILTTPVQLVSSVLPLILMPSLARSGERGSGAFLREWLLQARVYAAASAGGVVLLGMGYSSWSRLAIGETSPRLLPAVLLAAIGILWSSWSSSAVQVLLHPTATLLVTVAVASVSFGCALLGTPAVYLVALPYFAAVGIHTSLILRKLIACLAGACGARVRGRRSMVALESHGSGLLPVGEGQVVSTRVPPQGDSREGTR